MKKSNQNSVLIQSLVILGLILLAALLYTPILYSPFQLDDHGPALLQNYALRQFPNIGAIWEYGGKSRFLTSLTFSINYYLHANRVFGYHLVSLVVHIINSFLLFLWIKITFQSATLKHKTHVEIFASFAALVFAVHPIQTAAVTYIVQRSTVLAAFFYLSSLLGYGFFRLTGKRFYYLISITACVMAMFTKEIAFTLPLMIILYDRLFWHDAFTERAVKSGQILPFLLSLFIIPLILYSGDAGTFSTTQLLPTETNSLPRSSYFLTQLNVICTYLRLLILPINQNLDYDYPVASSLWSGHTLFSALLLSGLFIGAVRLIKTNRLVAFAIFWFFLTLSIESSFIPIHDLIFEHRLYLPMVGFAMIVPVFLYRIFPDLKKRISFFLIILCLFSTATWQRNQIWKSSLTLWQDVVEKSPAKGRGYHGLAFYYQNQREFDKAIQYAEKAIRLEGNNPLYHFTRAVNYGFKGDFRKEIEILRETLSLKPYEPAKYHRHLGLAHTALGQYDEAIAQFKIAIAKKPLYPPAYFGLGAAFEANGNVEAALQNYRKATQLDPFQAEAYNALGVLYAKKGDLKKAIALLNQAIHSNPHLPDAYNNLATAYSKMGVGTHELIPIYEKAIRECPYYITAYENLSHAYTLTGDYKRASEIQEKGRQIKNAQKNTAP